MSKLLYPIGLGKRKKAKDGIKKLYKSPSYFRPETSDTSCSTPSSCNSLKGMKPNCVVRKVFMVKM